MTTDQNHENDRRIGDDATWKIIQKNTFTRWINERLKIADKHIENIETDLSDGLKLIALLEILSGKKFQKYNKNPVFRPQKLENVTMALKFLQSNERIRIVNIDSTDIVDHNLKLILGLVWMLINHYSISIPNWGDDDDNAVEVNSQTHSKTSTASHTAIGALVDGIAPGLCPDWEDWNSGDAVKNAGDAMTAAEVWLGVPQLITPEEMCNKSIDEQSMMTYLSQFTTSKLREGAPLRPKTNVSRAGENVDFTVETFKAGKGELTVEIVGPDGKITNIEPVFNNDTYLTYTCSYTPTSQGQYQVKVKYSGREIPKSPFVVSVERSSIDPKSVLASGPGLTNSGLYVGEETFFDVTHHDVGTCKLESYIVDPTGVKSSTRAKVTKISDAESVVSYTPLIPGVHTVHVNVDGLPVPNSPFTVHVLPKFDPNKYLVSGRGVQKSGVRLGDLVAFKVTHEDGHEIGQGDLKVEVTDDCGNMLQINNSTLLYTYEPKEPSQHRISIFVGSSNNNSEQQHIAKSPYVVEIKGQRDCNMVVYGPGLSRGVVGRMCSFCLEANGENGSLAFQIEGPSQAQIDCLDNEDGSALISYVPVQAGEYAIHVMCDDDDISGSPFIADIIDDDDPNFKPENIQVSGPTIADRHRLLVNTPTQFSVDHLRAGKGQLAVGVFDSEGNTVLSLRDVSFKNSNKDNLRSYELTPKELGRHNLLVSYNGSMVPGSPFKLTVLEPSDPAKVKLYGPALENDAGDVSIMLTYETGQDVPMVTEDEGTNSFKVTFTPTRMGKIEGKVYFGEVEIPASPIFFTCRSPIDLSGVKVHGLDSKKFLESPNELIIDTSSVSAAGDLKVVSRSPSGTRALVPMTLDFAKGQGVYCGLFTFFEEGAHNFDIRYDNIPIRNDPFVVEGVSGCDPSHVKVYGSGLKQGLTNHTQTLQVATRGAGQGTLKVSIFGPTAEPTKTTCRDNGDGTCSVEYIPKVRGTYNVEVTFAGQHVDESPYRVEIKDDVDISKIKFFDLDNLQVKKGQTSKFKVDTKSCGRSDLKAVITDIHGSSRDLAITSLAPGLFEVVFAPSEEGLYCIDVYYGGQKVKSSSKVQVMPAFDASKVKMSLTGNNINNNNHATTTTTTIAPSTTTFATLTTTLDVDVSEAGEADLNASVEDHLGEELANRITPLGQSKYRIEFQPMRVGHVIVYVTYGGEHVIGSPLRIPVLPSGDANLVKLLGDELDNEDYRIPIDHSKAGLGRTTFSLRGDRVGDVGAEILENNSEGVCEILYQLPEEDVYRGRVQFGGQEVTGLSFVQEEAAIQQLISLNNNNNIDNIDATTATSTTTTTTTRINRQLSNGHHHHHHQTNGYLDGTNVSLVMFDRLVFNIPVGPVIGFVQARITTPNGITEIPEVINNQDGTVTISYLPYKEGLYTLSIDYNDQPLQGCSPLEFKVERPSIINKVKAVGPGLVAGVSGAVCRFAISIPGDVDFAGLAVSIDGPSKCPIDVEEARDGLLNVTYLPSTAGTYSLSIFYGHHHIQGSPFTARILPSSRDLTLAEMYIGSRDNKEPVDLDLTFNVKDLQAITCSVTSASTGLKQNVPLRIMTGGKLGEGALFSPKTEGEYTFELFRSGRSISRPPIKKYIKCNQCTCTDVNKVKVRGPGLVRPRTEEWNYFIIDYRNAGTGGLNISIDGPSKVQMNCSDDNNNDDYDNGINDDDVINYSDDVINYANDNGEFNGGKYGVSKIGFKPAKAGSPFILKVASNDNNDDDIYCGNDDDGDSGGGGGGGGGGGDGIVDQSYLAISQIGKESYLNLNIPGVIKNELRVFVCGPSGHLDSCYFKPTSSSSRPPQSSSSPMVGASNDAVGHYSIAFIPKEAGIHLVHVSRRGQPVTGSPFRFLVGPLFESKVGNIKVSGEGLFRGCVGVAGTFTVDTKDAGDGNLSITMEGPMKPDVSFKDNHDGTCTYLLSVRFNGQHITGSPYSILIDGRGDGDGGGGGTMDRMEKKKKRYMPNEPIAYEVTASQVKGQPLVKVVSPRGDVILPIVQSLDDDNYVVRFLPHHPGLHRVEVTQMGRPLSNSPFKLFVGDLTSNPEKVICSGQGLTSGHTGEHLKFQVHTEEAGCGSLEVAIDGPSKVNIRCLDLQVRPLTFVYVPHCPGVYKVSVLFDGKSVTKSPYRVKVKGPGQPLPWNELSKCEVLIPATDDLCGVYTSCNECLGKTISNITKCYWCTGNESSGVCLSYPSSDSCPFGKSRWQACFISYDIMILCLAILAVLIVLFLLITLYCSCKKCFRKRAQRREDVENRRHTLENEERRTRNEQRAIERRVKYDEIRQKYG
ncbi:hypothetical protein HELRODRAFT_181576 [Helobdella robusta]|uniref:Calponin-homology (CH) domain-containing protein n=1 Tax=Helobdella robusta TaxID=6412 RepID=T1FH46_HELRO|nr:hypothetical protein HELRODRAFT_181576 [Helobdella robusta]ESN92240.1 hypothetical protein HELRODRAFT_181576 [Helobdella robusta]